MPSPLSFVARARAARAGIRRQELARRLLRAGLIDGDFLSAQLNASFASETEAAEAWAATEARLQYAPHPLIEPAWLNDKTLSGASGSRRSSAGPQLALPGQRDWIDEAAEIIAHASPTDLLPAAPRVVPLTYNGARGIAFERAHEFARQNARSLRRHASSFSPPASHRAPEPSLMFPLVSIVMPVRDREAVIGAAIDSVMSQQYPHWELLVVDDGSTDATPKVVGRRSEQDPRIRLIVQAQTGVSAARNRGIADAAGELVAFLDSDNTWTPEHLAAAVAAIGDGSTRAVHTVVRIRSSTGAIEYAAEQVDRDTLLDGRNAVDLNALVVGRSVLSAVGGFDESLRRWVDLDLVLRLSKVVELRVVPVVGVDYDHRLDVADRITTRESPRWRRVVLERALVDWGALENGLPHRIDGVSLVIRSRGRWASTFATIQHARSLEQIVDVTVVDAASPRAETGILALATGGDSAVTVVRTAWDGGITLSAEIALAATRGRTVIAVDPGSSPSAESLAAAVTMAQSAGGLIRTASDHGGIRLVADVAACVAARGFDLVDDPLSAAE